MSFLDRDTADARLADNVRKLREQAGISQTALAEQMRERGHGSWKQQTVTRVEGGIQPVRYSEAVALAAILHASLNQFTWTSPEVAAEYLLNMSIAQVHRGYETIADRSRGMLATQENLRGMVEGIEREEFRDSPNIKGTLDEAYKALEMTPEDAADEGRAAFEGGDEEGEDDGGDA